MNHRKPRVEHQLRDCLAEIIEIRVSDPRLRGASVTAVKVSTDLGLARVFYRTLGDPEEAAQAFESAKPFIRRCLGEGIRMRHVPELDFRLDVSLDNAQRIEEILREIKEESR